MGKRRVNAPPFMKDAKIIFIDTMFFIYHFEQNIKFLDFTSNVLSCVESGTVLCYTSYLTLMEILVKPMKEKRLELIEEYKMVFETFPNLNLMILDKDVAYKAAYFRSSYNLKPADSIQIASAVVSNADLFLTNDRELIQVKEINICYMDETI